MGGDQLASSPFPTPGKFARQEESSGFPSAWVSRRTLSPGCACPPVPSRTWGFQEKRLIRCWFQFHPTISNSLSFLLFFPLPPFSPPPPSLIP